MCGGGAEHEAAVAPNVSLSAVKHLGYKESEGRDQSKSPTCVVFEDREEGTVGLTLSCLRHYPPTPLRSRNSCTSPAALLTMGGWFSGHLSTRDKKYLSGHTATVLRNFSSHLYPQLCAALLEREQVHMGLKDTPRTQTVLLQREASPGGEVLLEGAVLLYLDGLWRRCHLQVTAGFAVESYHSSEVCEGCPLSKTNMVLAGSHICTSVQEHHRLVEMACQ
ncbi:protein Niban-like, partial [Arapaima gigas]